MRGADIATAARRRTAKCGADARRPAIRPRFGLCSPEPLGLRPPAEQKISPMADIDRRASTNQLLHWVKTPRGAQRGVKARKKPRRKADGDPERGEGRIRNGKQFFKHEAISNRMAASYGPRGSLLRYANVTIFPLRAGPPSRSCRPNARRSRALREVRRGRKCHDRPRDA